MARAGKRSVSRTRSSRSPSASTGRSRSISKDPKREMGRTPLAAETDPHPHLGSKNLVNALLALLAPVPSIWASRALFSPRCVETLGEWVCGADPLVQVNVLFFVNVTVLFWLVGLLQGSFWLIDPYWTLIPPMIALFVSCHPRTIQPMPPRLLAASVRGEARLEIRKNVARLPQELVATLLLRSRPRTAANARRDLAAPLLRRLLHPSLDPPRLARGRCLPRWSPSSSL
ncbi:hypothetical protein T484DRAFT_3156166 [Baffinella frigidus]|nr:hypothetical protein T484DRAFT_3156166 [Cryptophyta sp. CCMP2293]